MVVVLPRKTKELLLKYTLKHKACNSTNVISTINCNSQEMIHLSVWCHLRRLIVSAMIFGTAVLFMLWLPIRVIKAALPGFLPYAVSVHAEAPVNELSLELLLLQVSRLRS